MGPPSRIVWLAGWLLAGCTASVLGTGGQLTGPSKPARPAQCTAVTDGDSIAALLKSAGEHDAFCLAPGSYPGPIEVPEGVTVWGPADAVIVSSEQLSTGVSQFGRAMMPG